MLQEHNIQCVTKTHEAVSLEYFPVIFAHESKLYVLPKALLIAFLRFLSMYGMVGTVDEYRVDGRLVGFCSTVVKGTTLRAMWFYQRPSHGHCMIWFHSVRSSLVRAMKMQLRHVDLGPSVDEHVAALKTKYGFEYSDEWQVQCDYQGPFRYDVPAVADLGLETDRLRSGVDDSAPVNTHIRKPAQRAPHSKKEARDPVAQGRTVVHRRSAAPRAGCDEPVPTTASGSADSSASTQKEFQSPKPNATQPDHPDHQ